METRILGKTGLKFSVLSFGCGAVGGLMVKGAAADQERAVARAMEFGINYFDTAPSYGNGESERNLGRVLKALKRPKVYVGTKVFVETTGDIERHIADAMEASLQRLGLDSVDLYQLHNPISDATARRNHRSEDGARSRAAGLCAFARAGQGAPFRIHGLGRHPGDPQRSGAFESAQVSYNLLNPSAGAKLPSNYPAQDYGNLIARAHASGVGTIGIRVLAGGALSGVETRHPLGMPKRRPDRLGLKLRRRCGPRGSVR